MLKLPEKVIPSEHVLFQELSGEAVLLDMRSERYFGLNELGTRIWGLLKDGRGLSDIEATLLLEYAVDQTSLANDLREFVSHLLQAGLAEAHDEATGEAR